LPKDYSTYASRTSSVACLERDCCTVVSRIANDPSIDILTGNRRHQGGHPPLPQVCIPLPRFSAVWQEAYVEGSQTMLYGCKTAAHGHPFA